MTPSHLNKHPNERLIKVSIPNSTTGISIREKESDESRNQSFTPSFIKEFFLTRQKGLIPYTSDILREKIISYPVSLPQRICFANFHHEYDSIKPACERLRAEGFVISFKKTEFVKILEIPSDNKGNWIFSKNTKNQLFNHQFAVKKSNPPSL